MVLSSTKGKTEPQRICDKCVERISERSAHVVKQQTQSMLDAIAPTKKSEAQRNANANANANGNGSASNLSGSGGSANGNGTASAGSGSGSANGAASPAKSGSGGAEADKDSDDESAAKGGSDQYQALYNFSSAYVLALQRSAALGFDRMSSA
jgi:hypothetical protein